MPPRIPLSRTRAASAHLPEHSAWTASAFFAFPWSVCPWCPTIVHASANRWGPVSVSQSYLRVWRGSKWACPFALTLSHRDASHSSRLSRSDLPRWMPTSCSPCLVVHPLTPTRSSPSGMPAISARRPTPQSSHRSPSASCHGSSPLSGSVDRHSPTDQRPPACWICWSFCGQWEHSGRDMALSQHPPFRSFSGKCPWVNAVPWSGWVHWCACSDSSLWACLWGAPFSPSGSHSFASWWLSCSRASWRSDVREPSRCFCGGSASRLDPFSGGWEPWMSFYQ